MDPLFDEQTTAQVFTRLLDEASHGARDAFARRAVDNCTSPELEAWARYGLTWSDPLLGNDEDDWAARLRELSTLDRYVQQTHHEIDAATDTGVASNCVWMDVTTLASAVDLLGGPAATVSPGTVLDLEAFVRSVVLYDHIFCMPNPEVDVIALNERLGHERIVLPLPIDKQDLYTPEWVTPLGALLYALYMQSTDWMWDRRVGARAEMWRVMLDRWETVLGWRPNADETTVAFDRHMSSATRELVTWLTMLTETRTEDELLRQDAIGGFPEAFIAQSATRCLFNSEIARTLSLPYTPNTARLPFRTAIIARQRDATMTASLDEVIDATVRQHLARLPLGGTIVPLPTFVAALTSRVDRTEQLPEALMNLRNQAHPLRQRRLELQEALDNPETRIATVNKLTRALASDVERFRVTRAVTDWAATAATVIVSLAFTSPVPAAIPTTIGLARMATTSHTLARHLYPRLHRPYEHVLTDLGSTARNIGDAIPVMERLWRRPSRGDWETFRRGLDRLGTLRMA